MQISDLYCNFFRILGDIYCNFYEKGALMWLEELLETIPIGEKVAVKIDQDVKVDEVQQLLFWARKDAIAHIEEVLPNGYTDGNGISYLQITCEDVRERGDEDSLPFPAFE